MLNNENEYIKMCEVESEHWWYVSLHELTVSAIRKYFSKQDISILDAGCGTGGLLKKLKFLGYNQIFGFDISPYAVKMANSKDLNVIELDLNNIRSIYESNKFDVVISLDNLYFLTKEEQLKFYKSVDQILKVNGIFIVNIPINKSFSGMHDHAVGINERFNAIDFLQSVKSSGLSMIENRHWPLFLSPVIFFVRTYQRVIYKYAKNVESDITIPGLFLNKLFEKIMKIEKKLIKKGVWSSSLFVVFKKIK